MGISERRQALSIGMEGGRVNGSIIPAGRPPWEKLFLTVSRLK